MASDAATGSPGGLPSTVAHSEIICRFVCTQSNMSKENLRVKRKEFMPHGSPLAVSVFRITDLDDGAVWEIARDSIVDRTVYGRGDLPSSVVYEVGLGFEVDDIPPRHANIIGWQGEKKDWMALALHLEEAARLVLP